MYDDMTSNNNGPLLNPGQVSLHFDDYFSALGKEG